MKIAMLALVFIAVAVAPSVSEARMRTPIPDGKGVHGFFDAKMNAYFNRRILSDEAKTTFYEEAVNAFRTHYDDNGSWQGEYWGKTMLSAVAVERLTHDGGLADWIVTNAVAFVKEFQRPDGYLCTYSDPAAIGPNADGSERFCWNIWSRKYTLWALVDIVTMIDEEPELGRRLRADGRSGNAVGVLENAAIRLLDHLIVQTDGVEIEKTGYFAGLPSMSVLKPCMLLYRRTGKTAYLRFAEKLVRLWDRDGNPMPNLIGNAFSDLPVHAWYPNPGWWAKAYEMMSCLEGVLDYADCVGDRRLVDAVRRDAEKIFAYEANPFGSVGYFDHFANARACPNATTELCDVIHWMRLSRELFLATRESRYLDRLEDAFLNGFLPGVYRDGGWAAHGTRSHGRRQFVAPHQVNMKYHHCCVDNACRAWYSIYESAVALDDRDGTVYVNLYFNGDYRVADGRGDVVVRVVTRDYPFCDRVEVLVDSAVDRPLRFRAPESLTGFRVNGVAANGGWVTLRPSGVRRFTATYERQAVLHDWNTAVGADPRPKLFEQESVTPEAKGSARTEGACYLKYGPLLLAKSSLVGDDLREVFDFRSVLGRGFRVSLEPVPDGRVRQCWQAVFSDGKEDFTVRVCDLQSCDFDDPAGSFSIWF